MPVQSNPLQLRPESKKRIELKNLVDQLTARKVHDNDAQAQAQARAIRVPPMPATLVNQLLEQQKIGVFGNRVRKAQHSDPTDEIHKERLLIPDLGSPQMRADLIPLGGPIKKSRHDVRVLDVEGLIRNAKGGQSGWKVTQEDDSTAGFADGGEARVSPVVVCVELALHFAIERMAIRTLCIVFLFDSHEDQFRRVLLQKLYALCLDLLKCRFLKHDPVVNQ